MSGSPPAARVFRLGACRICHFDADGDDQSENADYCSVCGFCLLRPVAPKRAPPPAPNDAAAKSAAPPASAPCITAAAAAASPSLSSPLSVAPSSHAPLVSGGQGKAPPPKRPPPPVPIMQIESVLQAFAKHEGSLESFDAPVIPGALPGDNANAAPLAATVSDEEQLQRALSQDRRATASKQQAGTGESPPAPAQQQHQQVLTVKTSKYDVVKVRMWRGGHFHVLSRYLLARVLSESGLGRADAVRLALAAKKRLVDAGRLDVPEEECGALLRSMLREAGHAAAVPAFDMLREWGARRSPLLVLVCGSALAGKAALSTALAHHLNLAAMIQAANVYRVACSIDEEQSGGDGGAGGGPADQQQQQQPPQFPREDPIYMHAWSSPAELEREYARRCAAVRKGLARDVDKALSEGRSVLIEGSLLDPTLFHDLLPLCAPLPLPPTHAPSNLAAPADAAPAPVLAAPSSAQGSSATTVASAGPVPPIVVSFHVTLSPERQRLLLHNHFSTAESLAPPALPAAPASPPAHAVGGSSAAGARPVGQAAPVSHAVIWRNLRWLEEIIAARHHRWRDMIHEHNERVRAAAAAAAAAAITSTAAAGAAPSALGPSSGTPQCPQVPLAQSVPLDNLHAAVESMRATVLDAIASQFQQEGRGRTASEVESERDLADSEKGDAAPTVALDGQGAAAAVSAEQTEQQRQRDEEARALVAEQLQQQRQQQQQQKELQELQEKEAARAAARSAQLAEEAQRAESARVLAEAQQAAAAEAKRRAEEAAVAEARAQSLAAAEKQKQINAETAARARAEALAQEERRRALELQQAARQREAEQEQQRIAAEAARAEAAATAAAAAEAAARAQAAERAQLEQQRQAELEASQRASREKREAEEQERSRQAARTAEEKALRERLDADKRVHAASEAARLADQQKQQSQPQCVDGVHCGDVDAKPAAPSQALVKDSDPHPPRRSSVSKSTALAMSRFELASHAAEDAAELKVQARLNAAVQWVDKEIRKLIGEIIKASATGSSSGGASASPSSSSSSSSLSPSVLYGALFESTQNTMEALSGTLMTAKRRGVVAYDGSLLLQRVHDHVRITLLKREIPDSPLPDHSKRKAPPLKPDPFATAQIMGNEKCFKCHKTVYPSERVGAAGQTYHAECFRCAHCHVILATATFCNNKVSNYCPSCYQMLINKHGANF